jgi:uncharacterized protein (TIGR02147 family)
MEQTTIFMYTDYREYLKAYFNKRKRDDPKFSHRYLSRRLGLSSPNFIMMVMQGKRNLTRSLRFRISEEFKHLPKEAEYFESMVCFTQAKTILEKDLFFNKMVQLRQKTDVDKIEERQYEYYANWFNPVIRELVTHPDFKGDPVWLAKKVVPRISATQAKNAVELLLELGLIGKKNGTFFQKAKLISTGPQVTSLALANFHMAMAQKAAEAIGIIPKAERDMTSCTISLSEKGFEQVREIIADCRKKILMIANAEISGQQVFQANFHLFPVSVKNAAESSKENNE